MSEQLIEVIRKKRESHIFEREAHSWYVEPAWVADGLFKAEKFSGRVWDPACGLGTIVLAARRAGYEAFGTDKVVRSDVCLGRHDFLDCVLSGDDIVSNPPFHLCDPRVGFPFIKRALDRASGKVCMLLPTVWANSAKTSAWLETTPLLREYRIGPRPSMPPGQVILRGEKPQGGRVDFSWFVWLRGFDGHATVHGMRREPIARVAVEAAE